MIKLRFKEDYPNFTYQNDIDRIVKIFAERGYEISHTDAMKGWKMVSNDWAAGWLTLYQNDEEIFKDCFRYMEEVK